MKLSPPSWIAATALFEVILLTHPKVCYCDKLKKRGETTKCLYHMYIEHGNDKIEEMSKS